jgi:hypothetical protein
VKTFIKRNTPKDSNWVETSHAILAAMKVTYVPDTISDDLIERQEAMVHLLQKLDLHKENGGDPRTEEEEEKKETTPLFKILLGLVGAAWHRQWDTLMALFKFLPDKITLQLTDMKRQASLASSSPNDMLVKMESLVEIIHYATIFLVGIASWSTNHVTQVKEVASQMVIATTPLVHEMDTCAPMYPSASSLELNLTSLHPHDILIERIRNSCAMQLESSLTKDWHKITAQSKKTLMVLQSILTSI